MFKTLVRRLGRPPRSYADYHRAFAPDPTPGGWARGDGAQAVFGDGWSLWNFNDAFKTDANGGATGFIRNSLLLIDRNSDVWFLSSGGGESTPGSASFPHVSPTNWCWLIGGYHTTGDSAMMIAGTWISTPPPYSNNGFRAVRYDGLLSEKPTNTAAFNVGLDTSAGIAWQGIPYREGDWIYIYGIHYGNLAHHVARHAYTADPSALGSGWEYWVSGTNWSTNVSSRGNISFVGGGGLRALSVIKFNRQYLFSAKIFDSAPEIEEGPDEWPGLNAWTASSLTGPLTAAGQVADVSRHGWHAYAGHVLELPGIAGLSTISSVNTGNPNLFTNYIYGPHFGASAEVGTMRNILYVGSSDVRVVTAADWNTLGVSGEPTRTWNQANGFEQVVSDAAATYLLTQPDFVDEEGIGFPDAVLDLANECIDLGNSGSARTLNASHDQFYKTTLSENVTFTLTGAVNGRRSLITIFIKQDPAVARTVTFNPVVKWPGTAYVASTGLGAVDKVVLESTDGGTTWIGTFWKAFA